MTFSEKLFEEFCRSNGIACTRVRTAREPTPDFDIELAGHIVTCEVKQIDRWRLHSCGKKMAHSSGW